MTIILWAALIARKRKYALCRSGGCKLRSVSSVSSGRMEVCAWSMPKLSGKNDSVTLREAGRVQSHAGGRVIVA